MARGTRREKELRRRERRRAAEAGVTVEELRLADNAAGRLGERPRAVYPRRKDLRRDPRQPTDGALALTQEDGALWRFAGGNCSPGGPDVVAVWGGAWLRVVGVDRPGPVDAP